MKEAVKKIIQSKEGYCVEIFGLMIYRDERGKYIVKADITSQRGKNFESYNIDAAIEKFFSLRSELKMGYDYNDDIVHA